MNRTLPSEQDVDQLLDVFFKSEMPQTWPDFERRPVVVRTLPFRPAAPRRRFVLGSKLALAASVALLMACGWLLSDSFDGPTGKGPDGLPKGKANVEDTKPDHMPMPKPGPDDLDHEVGDFLSR